MDAPTPARVKQCIDAENRQFGAVAVEAPSGRWGVMHPINGGGWVKAEQVEEWHDLTV